MRTKLLKTSVLLTAILLAACHVSKSSETTTKDTGNVKTGSPNIPTPPGTSYPSGPTKIELDKNVQGTPQITIYMDLQTTKSFSALFTLKGSQLVGSKAGTISPSYLALYDRENNVLLSDWEPTGLGMATILPGTTQAFAISVKKEEQLRQIFSSLRKVSIVFSVKLTSPQPLLYYDLKEICDSYPNQVQVEGSPNGCP